MTASDRFDLLFADALQDLAGTQYPDYFDDALEVATRRAQRPAWTFLERWIPMDTATRRTVIAPTFPWRTVGLILVIIALLVAAAAVAIVGSQSSDASPAPPFGPASNGMVVYASDGDIFARDMHGGPARKIVGTDEFDVFPHFSRDGTRISFIRLGGDLENPEDPAHAENLWIANADGTEARQILAATWVANGAWSVDGSQIAVIAEVDGGPRSLYVIDLADGSTRKLDVSVALDGGLDWRPPDGRELIFRGHEGNTFAIFGIRPDGTNLRQISADGTAEDYQPDFAMTPDGKKLVFTNLSNQVDLNLLDLDTRDERVWGGALPPFPESTDSPFQTTEHEGTPALSPDGKLIAFGRYWDERSSTLFHQIFIATLAGDGADAMPIGEPHRSRGGFNPFTYGFSPDGKHLIVQWWDQELTWLVDPTDGSYQVLPWGGGLTDQPTWQRVGQK
jgi:Tol biopolymer transport system component